MCRARRPHRATAPRARSPTAPLRRLIPMEAEDPDDLVKDDDQRCQDRLITIRSRVSTRRGSDPRAQGLLDVHRCDRSPLAELEVWRPGDWVRVRRSARRLRRPTPPGSASARPVRPTDVTADERRRLPDSSTPRAARPRRRVPSEHGVRSRQRRARARAPPRAERPSGSSPARGRSLRRAPRAAPSPSVERHAGGSCSRRPGRPGRERPRPQERTQRSSRPPGRRALGAPGGRLDVEDRERRRSKAALAMAEAHVRGRSARNATSRRPFHRCVQRGRFLLPVIADQSDAGELDLEQRNDLLHECPRNRGRVPSPCETGRQ